MKLSIIIPVYNEKNTFEKIIEKVESSRLAYPFEKEVIIIDDCSNDGTEKIIERLKDKHKIIKHSKNSGKGSCIIDGFKAAGGDYLIIQDADLEYDPEDYSEIIKPIVSGLADVVFTSRLLTSKPHRVLFFWHFLANKFLTTLSNIFNGLTLSDMESGYKAFNRRAVDLLKDNLISNHFGIEPELVAKSAKAGFRIYEVGISYYGRDYSEGKKINWRDGLAAIWHIIRFNLFR